MWPQTPQVGDLIADKYRIDGILGHGGMGIVFSATHQVTDKKVALKWMLPDIVVREGAVERFVREARIAGRISDPHVVDIYDVGQDRATFFLVMELLRGEALSSRLKRRDTDHAELLRILAGAARGVAAAHAQNVIHRDLKPDNIFVCSYPGLPSSAKVLDFGVSKLAATEGRGITHLTRTGSAVGTPYYMSPEQAKGERNLDHRSDIYSFGAILFEVITGRVPFEAETYNALIVKIVNERPPRPRTINPEVPEALEAIVMKAMAYERENRFSSMTELAEAIEGFLAGKAPVGLATAETVAVPLTDTQEGLSSSATGLASRSRRKLGVVLALVVVAAALGVAVAMNGGDATPEPASEPSSAAALSPTPKEAPATPPASHEIDVAPVEPSAQAASGHPSTKQAQKASEQGPKPTKKRSSAKTAATHKSTLAKKTSGVQKPAPTKTSALAKSNSQAPAKATASAKVKARSGSVSVDQF